MVHPSSGLVTLGSANGATLTAETRDLMIAADAPLRIGGRVERVGLPAGDYVARLEAIDAAIVSNLGAAEAARAWQDSAGVATVTFQVLAAPTSFAVQVAPLQGEALSTGFSATAVLPAASASSLTFAFWYVAGAAATEQIYYMGGNGPHSGPRNSSFALDSWITCAPLAGCWRRRSG